ncbi:MAG: nickel-dependent hydrogenase large subunit [Actinobacteria bacterium]|nr:nickel-dependent hydrogenase large subunit [Actinomycetota bacterium]
MLVVVAENAPDAVRLGYVLARPAGGPHGSRGAGDAGESRVELTLEVSTADAWVPTIADLSYPGGRFEREIRDLFGVEPRDHPLPRRLVRHAHWPRAWHPLLGRRSAQTDVVPDFGEDLSAFPFLEVGGDGVYEIPVGPVHAGLIEPGHFRFSVVGETIVRMKARLWYLHRGVERLFEGRTPDDGVVLAERISGDTAVGHTLAYALACEEALGLVVPQRDRLVRALLLELERMHNHAADLGMILNDVAFGLANVHLQRVRENLLRLNESVTGHRLLRGGVRVGGADVVALPDVGLVRAAAADVAEVVRLALEHPMVLDRLVATAVLGREDALRMGVLGYVARASGVDVDARRDHPFADPAALPGGPPEPVVDDEGDVLARFTVRAREVEASARFVVAASEVLAGAGSGAPTPPDPVAPHASPGGAVDGTTRGLGVVEAWRGLLCHRVTVGADGRLLRVKVVDPSFMNWPALPVALADTIVPDFPLANKSFNQSYAGNDL